MADEELEYDDLYFDDGDNYFYVDDGYALADELAETSVPEPGFYDFYDEWDDLTRFEYFNDIEYDSDGFHDSRERLITKPFKSPISADGQNKKRKRAATQQKPNASKRRKISRQPSLPTMTLPLVLFKSDMPEIQDPLVDASTLQAFSVLPDWREQFKYVKGIQSVVSSAKSVPVEDESESTEVEDEVGEDMPDSSDAMKALGLSLERKLSDMGLDVSRIDQSKLLLLAKKMMSQDEEAEELLMEIIEGIHGGEEKDEKDPFAQWVASKTADEANDEHEASDEEEPLNSLTTNGSNGTPTRSKRKHESPQTTPQTRKLRKRKA